MSQSKVLDPELLTAQVAWVRRLAHRLVDDPHLADDLVQSACVTALQSPPAHAGNLRGWFERVLRNLLRQDQRSNNRRFRREHRPRGRGSSRCCRS